MTNVEARLKIKGKNFEILVDVDKAIQMKKGMNVAIENVLAVDEIFYDIKKGLKVSSADLTSFFGTEDKSEAAKKIIINGEVQLPAEYRKKEQDMKAKQVIDFLLKHAVDARTGKPFSERIIQDSIKQAGINIDNQPVDRQINGILAKLKVIIPIKIETKRLKILIPAVHTGKAYGVIGDYKEKEEWLGNGDLSCVINLPAGLQMEFYDKLNAITHGSAIVEEIKQ
ncbi:ribosome assembly factor SBDS [Candidatus Pacearchaeota archaeon]|nr:ribosome assembly factor SBDS [Candidatus Pacearchaeota archaeon]